MIECGLVLRSIGYRGTPLAGIPFDAASRADPQRGRAGGRRSTASCRGEYVVGWIKRGPSGVIGTNKKDAADTVAGILADAEAGALGRPAPELADADAVAGLADERVPGLVTWAGLGGDRRRTSPRSAIPAGRPRVKLVRLAELIEASRATR